MGFSSFAVRLHQHSSSTGALGIAPTGVSTTRMPSSLLASAGAGAALSASLARSRARALPRSCPRAAWRSSAAARALAGSNLSAGARTARTARPSRRPRSRGARARARSVGARPRAPRRTPGAPARARARTTSSSRRSRRRPRRPGLRVRAVLLPPAVRLEEAGDAVAIYLNEKLKDWDPPKFMWRTLYTLLLLGLVFKRVVFQRKLNMPQTLQQIARVGPDTLGVAMLTSSFVGLVFTIQFCQEFSKVGLTRVIGGLGLAFTREALRHLRCIVLAGRVGSAIAAELGTMQVSEQVDQLRTLGSDPVDYLVAPRVIACAVSLPILSVISFTIGMAASILLADLRYGVSPNAIVDSAANTSRAATSGSCAPRRWRSEVIATISCGWGQTTTGGAGSGGEHDVERRHLPRRHLRRGLLPVDVVFQQVIENKRRTETTYRSSSRRSPSPRRGRLVRTRAPSLARSLARPRAALSAVSFGPLRPHDGREHPARHVGDEIGGRDGREIERRERRPPRDVPRVVAPLQPHERGERDGLEVALEVRIDAAEHPRRDFFGAVRFAVWFSNWGASQRTNAPTHPSSCEHASAGSAPRRRQRLLHAAHVDAQARGRRVGGGVRAAATFADAGAAGRRRRTGGGGRLGRAASVARRDRARVREDARGDARGGEATRHRSVGGSGGGWDEGERGGARGRCEVRRAGGVGGREGRASRASALRPSLRERRGRATGCVPRARVARAARAFSSRRTSEAARARRRSRRRRGGAAAQGARRGEGGALPRQGRAAPPHRRARRGGGDRGAAHLGREGRRAAADARRADGVGGPTPRAADGNPARWRARSPERGGRGRSSRRPSTAATAAAATVAGR